MVGVFWVHVKRMLHDMSMYVWHPWTDVQGLVMALGEQERMKGCKRGGGCEQQDFTLKLGPAPHAAELVWHVRSTMHSLEVYCVRQASGKLDSLWPRSQVVPSFIKTVWMRGCNLGH